MRPHLTSKKIVLSLLVLLLFAILLSTFIPQQFSTPAIKFAKWQQAHQAWQPAIETLDLHHIFTAPWFAILLFLFLISLSIATHAQFRLALKRTFTPISAILPANTDSAQPIAEISLPKEKLETILKKKGFTALKNNAETRRYIKHPWGHWGVFFLHLGILLSIAGSLLFTVYMQRGSIQLVEGETHQPSSPWLYEEHGILAEVLQLTEGFIFDQITPVFWPQGGIKNLISKIRFTSADGSAKPLTIAMNPIASYQNLRVYQDVRFGRAFYVLLTDHDNNSAGMVLEIASPLEPGKASYNNFNFPGIPYTIKAKYFADADKKNLLSDNPLLVIRLVDLDKVLGQTSLTKDHPTSQLGPYQIELVRIAHWSSFTFMTTPGVTTVFFGFFIFSLGGLLYYFTIPREIYCHKTNTGFLLTWNCPRFREHYLDEHQAILNRLQQTDTP